MIDNTPIQKERKDVVGNQDIAWVENKKRWKRISKRDIQPGAPEYSRVVPHRTTDSALQCLTAQIGRDAVSSLWYGPR